MVYQYIKFLSHRYDFSVLYNIPTVHMTIEEGLAEYQC